MSSTFQDPRIELLTSLDIDNCRISFSDKPIVLLCGGRVPRKNSPDAPDPPISSMRHAIVDSWPTAFEVFLPEEINDWQTDGIFKELVSLELELAAICSLLVIIPESEGSLVELGAFSQLEELCDKCIVVRSNYFADVPSFINFGIMRFLAARNPSRVMTYPWCPNQPQSISKETINDVINDIENALTKQPSTQVLKPGERTHSFVVICELLRLFSALKENEILIFLEKMQFRLSKDDLRRKLFLLKSFKFIKTVAYSDATFYMRDNACYHKLQLVLKNKTDVYDEIRFLIKCRTFYKNEPKFRNWDKAITSYLRR